VRFERERLVASKPCRRVTLTAAEEALTAAEEALATRVWMRHHIVLDLPIAVGVPPELAEAEAEGLEHHASDATVDALLRFLNR
jgi:DtxR family manganese transport transcriptional regulator